MAWFLRTTRFGTRMVYGQQAEQSCGIASDINVNYYLKKWELPSTHQQLPARTRASLDTFGIQRYITYLDTFKSEAEVDAAYAKVSGQPYDGSTSTNSAILALVLDELNIGNWGSVRWSASAIPDLILNNLAMRVPLILRVKWRNNIGHFVASDAAGLVGRQYYADFCDPWDASIHTLRLNRGQPINYQVDLEAATTSHYYYASDQSGDMDGWVVQRRVLASPVRARVTY
jgi:hypothetical protein